MMNLRNKLLVLGLLIANILAFGQTTKGLDPLIQNVYNRDRISLNGFWKYTVDPLETGYYDYRRRPTGDGFFRDHKVDNYKSFKEYDFDSSPVMPIPGDWNTFDDNLFLYEGTIWFRQQFLHQPKGNRTFLYFGASNYDTKIYLNGKKVGEHEGGYTPFNFDVTNFLQAGKNNLIVKVDNKRRADAVPTNNFDWFNYGGITRDVMLVEVPQEFIQSYKVQLKKGSSNIIEIKTQLSAKASGQKVDIEIPELKIKKTLTTDSNGFVMTELKANPQLWSPESPKLYSVKVSTSTDKIDDEIGFRTIETRGREILLNGKSIFLKGISIHEEAAFRNARIFSEDEDLTLLNWAKDLGCNYVRLAHYPHNEQMVRLAEKMGLLVWSEIPVYWTIHWDKDYVYENALNQLDEMIERDQNRANVIVWSIANETPHGDARDKFLSSLSKYAKEKDNTRLISMAMERKDKSKTIMSIDDNMNQYVDIISVNQYIGWYEGTIDKIDQVRWEVDYEKPLMISEFGSEAVAGSHSDDNQIWTEEFQADYYARTLRMIDERMPYVAGISPWVLKDFRSSRRLLPGIQDGFNRKGVISDRGDRKQAFYVLKNWYKTK